MSGKIKYFPQRAERKDRLNLKNYRVPCQVSGRWLQFSQTASPLQGGDFMTVDVMTMGANEKERKLCELVLTKQDLLRMIEQVKTKDSSNI